MSIKNKEEISIHLKTFRNLSNYTTGRYMIRVSLHTLINNKPHYAIPINVIEKKLCNNNSDNEPLTDEVYYMSKSFALKGGANVRIFIT